LQSYVFNSSLNIIYCFYLEKACFSFI